MKILFVAPRYYPYIGGVEYVVKSLAERLAKMGHEVMVLAGEPSIDYPVEEELNRVHVVRWPTWAPSNAYHIPRKRSELAKFLKDVVSTVDVVHVHSAHAVLPIYVALKTEELSPSTRLVVTLHYHARGHTALRNFMWRLWRRVVSKALKHADKIHAVSQYEANLIRKDYPHTAEKITVIPNGVEEDVLNYRWQGQNSDYVMYAGRIEQYKRLEQAIDIAKKLDLKLLIVGEGPYKKKLMKYAEKHHPGKVLFLEPQPRPKYLELLANARYAINLSNHEAYSIFIAEALAMSVPAIVSETIVRALGISGVRLLTQESFILTNYRISSRIRVWYIVTHKLLTELY